ncbi:MAG TPA: hypothetical protein VFH31_21390, partial [Pyrinomonadaceae bacterium]|nr:hypothetical protein [Pyrinomonadaceae bacterium]
PYVAIVITAAVMLVLTLSATFIRALTISAIARLVTYAATCAALLVFRKREDVPPAMFKVRGGAVAAVASLILAVWLLSNSTGTEARDAFIAAAVGIVIYFAYRVWSGRKRVSATRSSR